MSQVDRFNSKICRRKIDYLFNNCEIDNKMWLRDTVDENASLKILIFNGRINCGDKLLEFRIHVSKKSVQYNI